MEILRPKVYHRKSAFFEMTKKLKIGRGWPKSAGRVLNRFGTSQQKHSTPFHNKIMLLSSILKKISPTKRGVVISGQHGRVNNVSSLRQNRMFSFFVREGKNFILADKFYVSSSKLDTIRFYGCSLNFIVDIFETSESLQ